MTRMQVADHQCRKNWRTCNSIADIHHAVVDMDTGIAWEGFSRQQAQNVAEYMEAYYKERGAQLR